MRTVGVPSSTMRKRPRTPAMCPAGKAARLTPLRSPSASAVVRISATSVLVVCCTPFGSAVVPEGVNEQAHSIGIDGWQTTDGPACRETVPRDRAVEPRLADHDDLFERVDVAGGLEAGRVVDVAPRVRHDKHGGARPRQDEPDLARPVDGDDRHD